MIHDAHIVVYTNRNFMFSDIFDKYLFFTDKVIDSYSFDPDIVFASLMSTAQEHVQDNQNFKMVIGHMYNWTSNEYPYIKNRKNEYYFVAHVDSNATVRFMRRY